MIKRGQAIKRLKPYQQGHLDCLCGIYALVNAVTYLRDVRGWKKQSQLMAKVLEHLKAKGVTPTIARLTKEGYPAG
jgi:hypothetical protein